MPFFGCFRCSLSRRRLKRSRSSARSMASGEVPRIGTPASSSGRASLSGVWPPNCTMTPRSAPRERSVSMISSTSSAGERLEIEPIGGVVIGRDGLRVAVDHDRLVARVAERECRVAAAIIELDALADAVRSAAQDHHLGAVGRRSLVGDLPGEGRDIGRIHVGGGRGELGRAGVDALEGRAHVEAVAEIAHLGLGPAGEHREALVGEARRLELAEGARRLRHAVRLHLGLEIDDRLQLLQEPSGRSCRIHGRRRDRSRGAAPARP